MKEKYKKINNLSVSSKLLEFVDKELLKETNISPERFWLGFDKVIHELAPKNSELLETLRQVGYTIADITAKGLFGLMILGIAKARSAQQ